MRQLVSQMDSQVKKLDAVVVLSRDASTGGAVRPRSAAVVVLGVQSTRLPRCVKVKRYSFGL